MNKQPFVNNSNHNKQQTTVTESQTTRTTMTMTMTVKKECVKLHYTLAWTQPNSKLHWTSNHLGGRQCERKGGLPLSIVDSLMFLDWSWCPDPAILVVMKRSHTQWDTTRGERMRKQYSITISGFTSSTIRPTCSAREVFEVMICLHCQSSCCAHSQFFAVAYAAFRFEGPPAVVPVHS